MIEEKTLELEMRKEEFLAEKEMIDWLMQNGAHFHVAMYSLKYAKENKISIAAAYADCFLEESEKN